jgi:hypothetical protein
MNAVKKNYYEGSVILEETLSGGNVSSEYSRRYLDNLHGGNSSLTSEYEIRNLQATQLITKDSSRARRESQYNINFKKP